MNLGYRKMKNLMDIDFYNDNWDKTSFTLSDYTNIGISIYTNHDEQEHLDTDFYLNYVILTFKKLVYLKIQHYILTNQLQSSIQNVLVNLKHYVVKRILI